MTITKSALNTPKTSRVSFIKIPDCTMVTDVARKCIIREDIRVVKGLQGVDQYMEGL